MPDGGLRTSAEFGLGGERLVADLSGALWWPAERTLVFADLHFEKGSAFAARGKLVPPYDTRATLARMIGVILCYDPAHVICLGDSFHDLEAAERMAAADTQQLRSLIKTVDWTWIAGNHDPAPPAGWGGDVAAEVPAGALLFRHEAAEIQPAPDLFTPATGEVSGHYHPKAAVLAQGRRVTRPCFVTDDRRLILPAFGAFTGGLNVMDRAIRRLFPQGFTAHLLGRESLYSFPSGSVAFLG